MIEKFAKIGYLQKGILLSLDFKDPKIIDIKADDKEVFIIGDLHQDDKSFIDILKATQFLEKDNVYLIFLGDYIDRGVDKFLINKLLVLKHYFKERVILLRGNHEIPPTSSLIPPRQNEDDFFNYLEFLKTKDYVDDEVIDFYSNLFENLPILVNLRYKEFNFLLLHGGIPRFDVKRDYPNDIKDFFNLNSPINISYINDFLWNDFSKFKNFSSEIRYQVSQIETEYFLYKYNYDYLIRAHEAVRDGYRIDYDRVITIFSNGNNEKSAYSLSPTIFHLNSGVIYDFKDGVLKPKKRVLFTKFSKKFRLQHLIRRKKSQIKFCNKIELLRVIDFVTKKSLILTPDKLKYRYLKDLYGVDLSFDLSLKNIYQSPIQYNNLLIEVLEKAFVINKRKFKPFKYEMFFIKEL